MCGIAGIADRAQEAVDPSLIERMVGWLEHRGPDETGSRSWGPLSIGTARLSIVDLEGGSQPLSNENGRVWTVFNGEIYNFKDLRAELVGAGHRFRTRVDSEVLVHGYEQWGEDLFGRLKGMFGLCIVDLDAQRILLARDVAGEKPLFYIDDPRWFAFASEMKPLLNELPISRDLHEGAIQSYFAFGRPTGTRSAFSAIRKLAPASLLRYEVATGALSTSPFWSPPPVRPLESIDSAVPRLIELFESAIPRVSYADVPVGAFLSGGTDSSAVVAMLRAQASGEVNTFTVVYDDPHISEASEAAHVARLLGTRHHEVPIRPEDIAPLIPKMIWHLEEPFADASFIPTFFVSRAAREHVKVALTGDGGDELFGGYEWYRAWKIAARVHRFRGPLVGGVETFFGRLPAGANGGRSGLARYVNAAQRILAAAKEDSEIERLLTVMADRGLHGVLPSDAIRNLWAERAESLGRPGGDHLDELMLFQFRSLLPELFLTKVDRMSMANSLECRSPLLYKDVIDFALALPSSVKTSRSTGKVVLKKAFESFLPPEILYRPKKGFSIPMYRWLREEPRLQAWVDEYVHGPKATVAADVAGLDVAALRAHTAAYTAGAHSGWVLPWKAICFGIWWDTYVEGRGREPLESPAGRT